MSVKPILLGEAPSRVLQDHWDQPLCGSTAVWLCKYAGIWPSGDYSIPNPYELLTSRFTCRNAIERYEDAYPWTVKQDIAARHRWWSFLLDWVSSPINDGERLDVVCLGRHAASACSMGQVPWGDWRSMEGSRISYVVIPHPSGLNHLYNDEEMRTLARDVLQEALACE